MLIRKFQKKQEKSKKTRKIKFTIKERSWGTKFENLATFLPINTGLLNTLEGGQFWKKNTKKIGKPNPKIHLHPKQLPPPTPVFVLNFEFPKNLCEHVQSYVVLEEKGNTPKDSWRIGFMFKGYAQCVICMKQQQKWRHVMNTGKHMILLKRKAHWTGKVLQAWSNKGGYFFGRTRTCSILQWWCNSPSDCVEALDHVCPQFLRVELLLGFEQRW